jgi:hypothetical protein
MPVKHVYDRDEQRTIIDNSPERVLNTALRIVERSCHPDAVMNAEDIELIKPIVRKLWDEKRDEIVRSRLHGQ